MIGRAQITRRAEREGVSAATVERDWVLAHVVAQLPPLRQGGLVFKGGTSLRLCHVSGHRYSADLDFSLVGLDVGAAVATLERAVAAAQQHVGLERAEIQDSPVPAISYVGPLGRERRIKLDIAADELVESTCSVAILPVWDDLPAVGEVTVYTTGEILAEKLRCIMQRSQCRDLYDVHVLVDVVGVDPGDVVEAFRRKSRHRSLDPDEFATTLARRLETYKRRWSNELAEYVGPDVAPFDAVERAVRRRLRSAGLL